MDLQFPKKDQPFVKNLNEFPTCIV